MRGCAQAKWKCYIILHKRLHHLWILVSVEGLGNNVPGIWMTAGCTRVWVDVPLMQLWIKMVPYGPGLYMSSIAKTWRWKEHRQTGQQEVPLYDKKQRCWKECTGIVVMFIPGLDVKIKKVQHVLRKDRASEICVWGGWASEMCFKTMMLIAELGEKGIDE
jgi:hypothetical protein